MDYYKSLVPSQLLAERGAEIVVINPGSANVRIGLASAKLPISVPHCIAHHMRINVREEDAESLQKGAVGERWFGTTTLSAGRLDEREEVLELVASQLKLRSFYSNTEKHCTIRIIPAQAVHNIPKIQAGAGEGDKFLLVPEDQDTGFSWTGVGDIIVAPSITGSQESPASRSPKSNSKGEETATDGIKKHEDFDSRYTTATGTSKEAGVPQEEVERPQSFRKYICGEDSLKIPAGQPYCLYHPMCRGRLNVSNQYPLQQNLGGQLEVKLFGQASISNQPLQMIWNVCDDIYRIWDWVLTEKCYIGAKMRPRLSAVLVVPDTLDNREVKELLTVVLRDLRFHSAVVFQECVAATFGNGVSSGCIVNMGAQVTSVTCIEEGVAISTTRFVLPYGGEDITRCLLWVQQQRQTWPLEDTDVLHDPLDFQTLNKFKETHCVLNEGEQRVSAEVWCRIAGQQTRVNKVSLSSLNIPPMGLFYPSLLAPEEYSSLPRPWYHIDHDDIMDDILPEAGRRLDSIETGITNGNHNGTSVSAANNEGDPYEIADNRRNGVEELSIGLPQAIVRSILSLGRVDLQKKLFASIQLVGGVALTKGLVDAIEERVLHSIPAHEAVDTVEVLPNRMDPLTAMWKGGTVLAVLDFGRDLWVQYEDWLDGMVTVGSGRKYRDSNTLQAQAFWYNAMLD